MEIIRNIGDIVVFILVAIMTAIFLYDTYSSKKEFEIN